VPQSSACCLPIDICCFGNCCSTDIGQTCCAGNGVGGSGICCDADQRCCGSKLGCLNKNATVLCTTSSGSTCCNTIEDEVCCPDAANGQQSCCPKGFKCCGSKNGCCEIGSTDSLAIGLGVGIPLGILLLIVAIAIIIGIIYIKKKLL